MPRWTQTPDFVTISGGVTLGSLSVTITRDILVEILRMLFTDF